jgi:hypothetical protein
MFKELFEFTLLYSVQNLLQKQKNVKVKLRNKKIVNIIKSEGDDFITDTGHYIKHEEISGII